MNNDETLTEETDETNEELASNVRRQYHEMRDEITGMIRLIQHHSDINATD